MKRGIQIAVQQVFGATCICGFIVLAHLPTIITGPF
ncbi:hypothetical protein E9229_002097 [Paeniglutamicibacter cryotolerans]|uniref:Uncharacterized protein n=1 Tax=Paeniglutamicibacter cryotolerans TaxID=670079 RepID=A0A839QPJ1_9MICC|nr:hypothetical protein [Paeniglutamicibacter cryotolerans]